MARNASQRAGSVVSIMAENGHSPDTGTALANYTYPPSCDLDQPSEGQRGTWGGARNRADRVSHYLSDKQVAGLMEAARSAFATGRVFQRHWTVHYGKAGIQPSEGARFVGKLLDLVSKQARREGGKLSAIWVRECASDKGEHIHILMHLPACMSLRNRTRQWIVAAGGKYRIGVSKVTLVGGRLSKIGENREERQVANAENVVRYILKAGMQKMGKQLELPRCGAKAVIVGKRCGWTCSLGRKKRDGA